MIYRFIELFSKLFVGLLFSFCLFFHKPWLYSNAHHFIQILYIRNTHAKEFSIQLLERMEKHTVGKIEDNIVVALLWLCLRAIFVYLFFFASFFFESLAGALLRAAAIASAFCSLSLIFFSFFSSGLSW